VVDLELSADERRRMGDRLRAARWAANLTQQQVADAVGRSRTAARYWEREGFLPNDPKIRAALARVLDQPERVLFAEYFAHVDAVTDLLAAEG
jgi:transcriptional regulator with XRE-family HTH domain